MSAWRGGVLLLLIPLLLAGCAAIGSGAHPTSAQTPGAQTPATSQPQAGSSSATQMALKEHGCPRHGMFARAAAARADVTVADSWGERKTIALRRLQVVEFRMRARLNWRLDQHADHNALLPIRPQGLYDPTLNACVWRFKAVGSGGARLIFTGSVSCQSARVCNDTPIVQDYTLAIVSASPRATPTPSPPRATPAATSPTRR